jgi:hypothetical protein
MAHNLYVLCTSDLQNIAQFQAHTAHVITYILHESYKHWLDACFSVNTLRDMPRTRVEVNETFGNK